MPFAASLTNWSLEKISLALLNLGWQTVVARGTKQARKRNEDGMKPPVIDQRAASKILRDQAHNRLDDLLDQAESERLHGLVGVEVNVQAGVLQLVRRRFEGMDRISSGS